MKPNDTPILTVEQLSAGYGSHVVLKNVSFELKKGEVLGIIGQNGSGKSTLLKAITGLIPLKHGRLLINGKKKSRIRPHNILESGISFFTQGGLVMPALTVEEHLSLAHFQNGSGNGSVERVFDQFPRLFELSSQRAGSLSGGERQMLSFGILIAQDTKTWLLDEPTAGFSPEMVQRSVDFLQEKRKEGITMLLVEHNMEVAFSLSDTIVVAKEGTLTQKFDRQEFHRSEFLTHHLYN